MNKPRDQRTIEELRESFQYNDRDGDGKIDLEEFNTMLDELEAFLGEHEARIGFGAVDADRDGSIDFDEFFAWWTER